MILVIEGTDHAGKTTLAHRMAQEYIHGPLLSDIPARQVIRLHKGPPDSRPILEQYEGDLLQYSPEFLTGLNSLFILDRWHLGEALYGPLLRNYSRLADYQLTHVEMLLSALGAQRHLVLADTPSLNRRHELEPDEMVSREDASTVQKLYENLCGPQWKRTDMSDGRETDTRQLLGELIMNVSFAAAIADFPSYVGPLRPRALLVGDKPGGVPPSWARAFTPLKPGSASMLITSLLRDGRQLTTGMVNQKGTNLTDLWFALGMPRVITLGMTAHKAMNDTLIERWDAISHPQYIRRFQRQHWDAYISDLRGMIDDA